jgi:hypothetical protein
MCWDPTELNCWPNFLMQREMESSKVQNRWAEIVLLPGWVSFVKGGYCGICRLRSAARVGGRTKTRLLKGVTSECKHAADFRGNGLTRPPPTIPESDWCEEIIWIWYSHTQKIPSPGEYSNIQQSSQLLEGHRPSSSKSYYFHHKQLQ